MRRKGVWRCASAACIAAVAIAPIGTATATETRPVDVFIGDSSATNFASGVGAGQRWTRLFADADGAIELNVAVGGTGYLVRGRNRGPVYEEQLDEVLSRMEASHLSHDQVKRVFLVGGGNDFSIEKSRSFSRRLVEAVGRVAGRIQREFPDAQKLYIPEMSPATETMLEGYRAIRPYMPLFFALAFRYGFRYDKNWYQWLSDSDRNGYAASDDVHLSAKGHNEAAHWAVGWVNSLGGSKVRGIVPEWDGSADTVVRFNSHGGWGSIASLRGVQGTSVVIPSIGMTNEGHALVSWNTKADGSGESYRPGAMMVLPDHSVMLYAQWKTVPASASSRDGASFHVLAFVAGALGTMVLSCGVALAIAHRHAFERGGHHGEDDGIA